jgi:hypothetical protein
MQKITLIRTHNDGEGVYGYIDLPNYERDQHRLGTIENAETLIPEGTYPLRSTWSPRFGKNMPEICEVPDREGIRIHQGTKPHHSTGCVLVSPFGLSAIQACINYFEKYYDNEEIQIEVRSL